MPSSIPKSLKSEDTSKLFLFSLSSLGMIHRLQGNTNKLHLGGRTTLNSPIMVTFLSVAYLHVWEELTDGG